MKRSCRGWVLGTVMWCLGGSALAVDWDDGATKHPPKGDGISWNDRKNWEDDTLPSGDIGAVLMTDVVRVRDGLLGVAESLNAGSTHLQVDGQLTVGGAFSSTGTITIASEHDSPSSGAGLRVGGGTLQGEASIHLQRTGGPGVNPAVFSTIGPLTISPTFEVRGEGRVGADGTGAAEMINRGLVLAEDRDAHPNSELLVFGNWKNDAVIRSSETAGVRINGSIEQTSGGRIVADAGVVDFRLGSVTGGMLVAENGGQFVTTSDSTFRDVRIAGPVGVHGGFANDLFIAGQGVTNDNVITIKSNAVPGTDANLVFQNTGTLGGTGTVVLARQGDSSLVGAVGAEVTQAAGHRIRGEGRISAELVNHGIVEAVDVDGDGANVLRIQDNPNGSAGPTNNNIFRATSGALLDVTARLRQSSSGRLIADEQGMVRFRGAKVTGGSVETDGSGTAEISTATTFTNVTNRGTLNVPGGGSEKLLEVRGEHFTNEGVLTVRSSDAGGARLAFASSLGLSGAGEIVLAAPGRLAGISIPAGETVTQAADHTITGAGQITGKGTLVNMGVVAGAANEQLLDINVSLEGAGRLRDVFVDGVHSPSNPHTGSQTARVEIAGEYSFGNGPGINGENHLILELGGETPGDAYDQLVSTDVDSVVTLGAARSTLDVRLIEGFEPAVGQTFTLIDTAGLINGRFDKQLLPDPGNFVWEVQYTDQQLTLELVDKDVLPGDFNRDGLVEFADFLLFAVAYGESVPPADAIFDLNGSGVIDFPDFLQFAAAFGQQSQAAHAVPEPSGLLLGFFVVLSLGRRREAVRSPNSARA